METEKDGTTEIVEGGVKAIGLTEAQKKFALHEQIMELLKKECPALMLLAPAMKDWKPNRWSDLLQKEYDKRLRRIANENSYKMMA